MTSHTHNDPHVSIIAPLYNEEESVALLYEAISSVAKSMPYSYEIILVNDGSKDQTFSICQGLAKKDSNLRVIEFRANYGQTPAMAAGIDIARGEVLVTMDGDLQNDPTDIPMMIETLNEGYDIVVGWRHNRQDKLISRKVPSMIANRLIGKVTGVPIKDNGCSLKVYRAAVMKNIPFYNEMHRFIPAMLSLSGARYAEVKVKHHARQFGVSKYGLSRIYKVLLDLLTIKTLLSMVRHPVVWFSKLAAIPLVVLVYFVLATLVLLVQGKTILIYSSIVVLLLSSVVFLMSLGFICELIYSKGNVKIDGLAALTSRIEKPQK